MNDDDEAAELETDSFSLYLAQYRRHLAHVQAHLCGSEDKPLPPSFILPTGYWTPHEKDLFFHALSTHSRLRPDLIADSIKSKTIVDVCAYIDLLEDASSRGNAEATGELRCGLGTAMEVSESWIDLEEAHSIALIEAEPSWDEAALQAKRANELQDRATAWEDEPLDEDEATARQERYESWKNHKESDWNAEDVFSSLDFNYLRVLNGILLQSPSLLPQATTTITDDLIDPVLLASSSKEAIPPDPPPDPQTTNPSPDPSPPDDTLPLTPISAPRPLLPLPSSPASANPGSDVGPINPDDLSPKSRRRFQKRLYMRRKRAEMTGESVNEEMTKLQPGRKKKERKPNKPRPKKYRRSQMEGEEEEDGDEDEGEEHSGKEDAEEGDTQDLLVDEVADEPNAEAEGERGARESGDDDDDDADDGNDYAHSRRSGKNKRERMREMFEELGVDSETLRSDFGLFNLTTLGHLIESNGIAHGFADVKDNPSAIAVDTIRLLHAVVVDFITQAVHRSIISRELERKLKGGTKVWRLGNDEITLSNVEHALDMSVKYRGTKRKYPEDMTEDVEEGTSLPKPADAIEEDEENEEGSDEEEPGSFPILLPPHRELKAPIVRLPSTQPSHAHTSTSSAAHDPLLPLEIDEEALVDELVEEEELDKEDRLVEKTYEKALWDRVKAIDNAERLRKKRKK